MRHAASNGLSERHNDTKAPIRTGAVAYRRALAFCIGGAVFTIATLIEWFGKEQGWSLTKMLLASNTAAGLLAAFFALKLLSHAAERRERVRRSVETLANLNHEIRNALEVIQLSARYMDQQQALEHITQSVERIARVLREMDRRRPLP